MVRVAAAAAALLVCVQVVDEEAARFIASCVGEPEQRHTASQLLDDPFLQVRSNSSSSTLLIQSAQALRLGAPTSNDRCLWQGQLGCVPEQLLVVSVSCT